VLDGLLGIRTSALARRAITLVPAVVVLALGVNEVTALVWSQVVLSLALPVVALPLVVFTSRRDLMGDLVNGRPLRTAATVATTALVIINAVLLLTAF
jgi:manganese transport protein